LGDIAFCRLATLPGLPNSVADCLVQN